jgi:hypothetical protein
VLRVGLAARFVENHPMANREEGKKNWELAQCQLVAAEMNKLRGTDYEAHPGNAEPADVFLRSKSGAHPTLPVQVVSIPLDFRQRDDKHSVEKIKATLAELLLSRGVRHCLVGIILSGEAELHGMKHSVLKVLNEMILKAVATGRNQTLRYDEIYEKSSEVAANVHDILISHHEIISGVEIDIPAGSTIPPDGRWIEEGILKKAVKYGGTDAVKGLTLVIGVAGLVDDEQIKAFQAAYRPEALPFSQIWIVTPFHGVICLKA